jgi:hypothetical protein
MDEYYTLKAWADSEIRLPDALYGVYDIGGGKLELLGAFPTRELAEQYGKLAKVFRDVRFRILVIQKVSKQPSL